MPIHYLSLFIIATITLKNKCSKSFTLIINGIFPSVLQLLFHSSDSCCFKVIYLKFILHPRHQLHPKSVRPRLHVPLHSSQTFSFHTANTCPLPPTFQSTWQQ